MKADATMDKKNFFVGKNLEEGGAEVDMDDVEDLYDDECIFEEMKQEGNIILD